MKKIQTSSHCVGIKGLIIKRGSVQFFAVSRHQILCFYFGCHRELLLVMFSIRSLAFLVLILATSYLHPVDGESEERKNFKTIFDLLIGISNGFYSESNGVNPSSRLDCPLCDSSVYSYCSEKLLHDACCCLNPYEHKLPHQCKYADCGFLHANTCREHKLITACCCSKLL